MFLIVGVQPKQVIVSDEPRRCMSCGSDSVVSVREDQYFSLFFLPLFRVSKGDEIQVCSNCGREPGYSPPEPEVTPLEETGVDRTCVNCRNTIDTSFAYCPHCGQRQR